MCARPRSHTQILDEMEGGLRLLRRCIEGGRNSVLKERGKDIKGFVIYTLSTE